MAPTDADEEPSFPDRVEDVVRSRTGLRDTYEEVGRGAIVSDGNSRYWIHEDTLEREVPDLPHKVRDQLERGRGIKYLERELDGVEKLGFQTRADDFLKALDRELEGKGYKLEYEAEVDRASPRDARVPVWLAAEGQTYVAAYLAAHGFNNTEIAHALDVSESTIRVNLSKFKSGDL